MQKPTKKPTIVDKTLETSFEVVKDTATQVVDALNPLAELFGTPAGAKEMEGKNNYSQVDMLKLQNAYAQQDQAEIQRLTESIQNSADTPPQQSEEQATLQRHREVKREEEVYLMEQKQEKAEEERQEEMEKQQQEQAEAEQRQAQSQDSNPHGKVRKNVLGGGKKIASTELPAEVKPGGGKQ